ncbi:MAG: type VI secretion system baseplate subunit TssG [Hyphomicrobiales bacterium]
MADSTGKPPAPLTLDVLENSKLYSFVQAIRILALRHREPGETLDRFLGRMIRIRPELSLAFPATDLVDIRHVADDTHGRHAPEMDVVAADGVDTRIHYPDETTPDQNGCYHITATFLGLYGSSSPLPAFYTEELIEDVNEERFVTSDFINIVNSRFYTHFYRACVKYRPMLQAIEHEDGKTRLVFDALYGFGDQRLIEQDSVLPQLQRFSGVLMQMPRSASGLQTILRETAGHDDIFVEQCAHKICDIPIDARCRLGQSNHGLGDNSWLGREYPDRNGHFSIHIRNLSAGLLHALLPEGGGLLQSLSTVARYYVSAALSFDFLFAMAGTAIRPFRLGETNWGRLGVSSWLFSQRSFECAHYRVSGDLMAQKPGLGR